jgi:hypothetical protein
VLFQGPREKVIFGKHVMCYDAQNPLEELVLAKSVSIHESLRANQICVA